MVLPDPSTSTSSDFNENNPPSDVDPYSSSSNGQNISLTDAQLGGMPQPFPLIGPLFGYNDALLVRALHPKLNQARQILKRDLTTDEILSFTYWSKKQISIMSYAPAVGISGGLYRAYSCADRFRFPFFQPDLQTFNKEIFPHPRMPLFQGQRAVLVWHAARAFWYGAAGHFLAKLFFGSYAMSVAAVGEASDPRLKDFIGAIRKMSMQKRGGLPEARVDRENSPQTRNRTNPVDDDASPTGGMYTEEDFSSGRQSEAADVPVPQAPAFGSYRERSAPQQAQVPGSQSQPFDYFDEALPTSGQGVQADTRAPQLQMRGSAWDRLRRGAQTGQPQQGAWSRRQSDSQQEEGSATGETSFSSSKSAEDKKYSREDAQKEFDARVERERRGEDFSSGGGNQKRW